MSSVAIIADDLTGANATGSLLAGKGFSVASCLSLEQWNEEHFSHFDVAALNAATRLIPQDQARARMAQGIGMVLPMKPKVVSKRIDSTLRGNMGGEIEAALQVMDRVLGAEALAVVVPAFPASGRQLVGGFMLVNGVPLENTTIAKDPVTPITTSCALSIIAQQTNLKGGRVDLKTMLAGPEAVKKAILDLRAQGCRMVVLDGATDAEITTAAEALRSVDFPVLAVDPGPFTAALAAVKAGVPSRVVEDRVLAIVGSVTELTQRQLEALRVEHPCHIVRADCTRLLNPSTREEEISSLVRRVAQAPADAKIVGVCTAECATDVQSLTELGAQYGLVQHQASDAINAALAEVCARLLAEPALQIGGLYTSGGEVTVAVTTRLEAGGFSVRDEIIPLAVYGRLIQGLYPDLPMVTKGGFVGDSKGLIQCLDYLIAKISTRTRNN